MPHFAVYADETVGNVIVADTQEIAEALTGLSAVETTGVPWIGWTRVQGEWIEPLDEDGLIEYNGTTEEGSSEIGPETED